MKVNNKVEKVIRNNKVAVLISPSFGSGWSSEVDNEFRDILLFHPKIVKMVEDGKRNEITEQWMHENFPEIGYVYCGGACNLEIAWIECGSRIHIHEYDGYESIEYVSDISIEV